MKWVPLCFCWFVLSINSVIGTEINELSLDKKIGQLYLVSCPSNATQEQVAHVEKMISKYYVGGVLFNGKTPAAQQQRELTEYFQTLAVIPLFIAHDAENGPGFRLTDVTNLPQMMTLGAIKDDKLIKEFASEVARQCTILGINVNFAPVVDVNNNSENPIIHQRSFGEDPESVAHKGIIYMQTLQEAGILACAKHFPGHGDVSVDSHLDLPVLNHSMERLQEVELYPFKALIKAGVKGIMVAHLNIPVLDPRKNRSSSLSANVVNGLLRKELGFEGLIFTDGLEMKAVAKHFKPGEADLEALLAGNDILVGSEDIPTGIEYIKTALNEGTLSTLDIDAKVRRILSAKQQFKFIPSNSNFLLTDLNSPSTYDLKYRLYKEAVTLARGELPDLDEDTLCIQFIVQGETPPVFSEILQEHGISTWVPQPKEWAGIESQLSGQQLIICLTGLGRHKQSNFFLSPELISTIDALCLKYPVSLCIFGTPYCIENFPNAQNIIIAYEEDPLAQRACTELFLQNISPKGMLPINRDLTFPHTSEQE